MGLLVAKATLGVRLAVPATLLVKVQVPESLLAGLSPAPESERLVTLPMFAPDREPGIVQGHVVVRRAGGLDGGRHRGSSPLDNGAGGNRGGELVGGRAVNMDRLRSAGGSPKVEQVGRAGDGYGLARSAVGKDESPAQAAWGGNDRVDTPGVRPEPMPAMETVLTPDTVAVPWLTARRSAPLLLAHRRRGCPSRA